MTERRDDIRAADVDREFVAERLKGALAEGRLSLTEYDERLREAYAAKTYGDLDRILADLPGVVPAAQAQVVPATPTSAPAGGGPLAGVVPRWLAHIWGAWLVAVSINVVIWLLVTLSTQEFVYPWPIWVAGPWGAVLLAITITGYLSGAPQKSAQEQAEREARRAAEREARRRRRERD